MRRETAALLELCATRLGYSAAVKADYGAGFDWELFVDSAVRHKCVTLAYGALSGAGIAPPGALATLKRRAAERAALKSMLVSEWAGLEDDLSAAGVRHLLIKGPALSLQLYGDPFLRDFRDIDLIVDEGSEGAAAEVFLSRGFERNNPFAGVAPRFLPRLERGEHHAVFKKLGAPLYIEVHPARAGRLGAAPVSAEEAFSRAQRLEAAGTIFPAPCLGHHALEVLVHGAHHEWCQLQWVLDALGAIRLSGLAPRDLPVGGDEIDPRRAIEAFALFADGLFKPSPVAGFRPAGALASVHARASASYAVRSFREAGIKTTRMARILSKCLFYAPALTVGIRGKLRSARIPFLPIAKDLRVFHGRLPYWSYFILKPFLAPARRITLVLARRRAAAGQETGGVRVSGAETRAVEGAGGPHG
jgi:hypothetical protein